MREVFVHQDSARVGHYKSILDSEGIPNFIRNGISGSWLTDLPSPVFFPVLCVTNDEDYERAIEVLRKIHKPEQTNAPDWKCPQCGEEVPGTFDSCWKCEGVLGAREVVAAEPQQAKPAPTAIPSQPPSENARRVADVFRWMLILQTVSICVWWFLPELGTLSPPGHVQDYLRANDTRGFWREVWKFASIFAVPLAVVANVLCIIPLRIGRTTFIVSLVVWNLSAWNGPWIFSERWAVVLWTLTTLSDGAILALMFVGPLAPHFRKDTQRATP